MPLLLAQSLVEYSGVSSNSTLGESLGAMLSTFMDGLRGIDQNTWLILGGVLLALAYFTRRSGRQ